MTRAEDREKFMREAILLAREAAEHGEIPVGCVIVKDGEIIARARNAREEGPNAVAHAETLAIAEACKKLGDWRLGGCTLFVTLEPCPMCAGAIINARVPEIVYGAKEAQSGSCGSVINLFEENYGHRPRVYGGVLAEECAALMREFFEDIR